MYDFIAIDFETATTEMNSACSLGIACVEKFEVKKTYYFLIQPPKNKYLPSNTEIHGISSIDTESAPTFAEIWDEIKPLFADTIVVAHNVRFDLSVLKACLDLYNLQVDDFPYIDSIAISNRAIKDKNCGQSLIERAAYFNIPIELHHNALNDAIVCAKIVINSVKTTNRKSLKTYCSSYRRRTTHIFSELKPLAKMPNRSPSYKKSKIKISDFTPTESVTNKAHPFYEKNVVLTGDLTTLTRSMAMQKIINAGGIIKSGVSSKTHFLIVGKQDLSVVGEDGLSSKERKAQELLQKDVPIKILNEKEFLKIINSEGTNP